MSVKIIGISIPRDLLTQVDELRGDVTRSRFITKRLKEALQERTVEDSTNEKARIGRSIEDTKDAGQ